jgi:hypothetical protein
LRKLSVCWLDFRAVVAQVSTLDIVRTIYENIIHCISIRRDDFMRLRFHRPGDFQKLDGQFGRLCHSSTGR